MMSDDQILEVVSAHKEGKKIEFRHRKAVTNWYVCGHPTWNFKKFDYRVAPEPPKPREWWMRCHRDDTPCASCGLFDTYALASFPASDHQPTRKIILVREVIGASSGNPTVASDTASSNQ